MRTPIPNRCVACSCSQGRKVSIRGTMAKCNTAQNKTNSSHPAPTKRSSHLANNATVDKVREGMVGASVIGASSQAGNYDPQYSRFPLRVRTICAKSA